MDMEGAGALEGEPVLPQRSWDDPMWQMEEDTEKIFVRRATRSMQGVLIWKQDYMPQRRVRLFEATEGGSRSFSQAKRVFYATAGLLVVLALGTLGVVMHARRDQRGGPADVGQPRALSELCNVNAVPLRPTSQARTFKMTDYWSDQCLHKVEIPPSEFGKPTWEGQNRCWRWIKKVGCYDTMGSLSWFEGQQKAAKLGYAPQPEILPFQGIAKPELCERYDLGAPLPPVPDSEMQVAKQWFRQNVAVYVVNLDKDQTRWDAMAEALASVGIPFQRIQGVDMRVANALEVARSEGLIPLSYDLNVAQAVGRMPEQAMSGLTGTVGCAAAHLRAMQQVVQMADERPLALVLEDDVKLESDFIPKLRRLLSDEAPCDWNAISLKSKCPHGECVAPHLLRVLPDGNEPSFRCRHGVNYGFFAMLYRISTLTDLRARLADTVWDQNRPHCLDIDVALASISDEIAYYAVPSMQRPGFLSEGGHGSSRYELNGGNEQHNQAPPAAAPPPQAVPEGTGYALTPEQVDPMAIVAVQGGIPLDGAATAGADSDSSAPWSGNPIAGFFAGIVGAAASEIAQVKAAVLWR